MNNRRFQIKLIITIQFPATASNGNRPQHRHIIQLQPNHPTGGKHLGSTPPLSTSRMIQTNSPYNGAKPRENTPPKLNLTMISPTCRQKPHPQLSRNPWVYPDSRKRSQSRLVQKLPLIARLPHRRTLRVLQRNMSTMIKSYTGEQSVLRIPRSCRKPTIAIRIRNPG